MASMRQLLVAGCQSHIPASYMHPGCLDFDTHFPPDGRGASACTIWLDPLNAVGLFEPVGTHPDFQGKGLGKAVMAEGMRRVKAAGMRRAIMGFDPTNAAALALYTSMGFRASCYFVGYRKEL